MRAGLFWGCVAAGVMLAAASAARAEDWIVSAFTAGSNYSIDLSTLTRRGDVVQSWMREDLARPAKDPGGAMYRQVLTQRYDDCVARKFSFGSSVVRDEKGEAVRKFENTGGWQDILPGSVAESVWRAACAATQPPKDKPLLADLASGAWTSLGESADHKYVLYQALDRVVRLDAQHVAVISRSDYLRPEWIEGVPVRYIVAATVMDCQARKSAAAGVDLYMSPTIRVRALRADNLTYVSLAPSSYGFKSLDSICAAAPATAAAEQEPAPGAMSAGTAWLTTKGYLVTADHVVNGAKSLMVYSNGERVGAAEIVVEDAANDLAVLKPVEWGPRRFPALPIATHGASLGRRVFTLGYPAPDVLGAHIKMSAGEVSATTGPGDDTRQIQISIPIQPGNSGGPVLGWDGAVVGVVDFKLRAFGEDADQPKPELVNYAVKAAYVRPMLEDLPELGHARPLDIKAGPDQMVQEVRKSVFMVIAAH